MCKMDRRRGSVTMIMIWTKILPSASRTSNGRSTLMKSRNLKRGASREQNSNAFNVPGARVRPSSKMCSNHCDDHISFCKDKWHKTKNTPVLLPVGCWEKQQPVGRKQGIWDHSYMPLKFLNGCYENKVYIWKILHSKSLSKNKKKATLF